MYLTIEFHALQLRKLVAKIAVLVVHLARDRDAVLRRKRGEFVVRLRVIVHHLLSELLHLRIGRAIRGDSAELDFSRARGGDILDEVFVTTADFTFFTAGRADCTG